MRILRRLSCCVAALLLAACGGKPEDAQLVVYTARAEHLIQPLLLMTLSSRANTAVELLSNTLIQPEFSRRLPLRRSVTIVFSSRPNIDPELII